MLELFIAFTAGVCLGVLLMCLLQINRVPVPQQETPIIADPPVVIAKKETPVTRYNPRRRQPETLP